ncbi:hypothetical protein [Rhodococcoides fascians]|uniref:hypothetical protein n=1 Tax=Rhodococcoides fascians TaxID=1828 RepID=UPI001E4E570E|nr:hypothetical protein [Rhodococcus fascians]
MREQIWATTVFTIFSVRCEKRPPPSSGGGQREGVFSSYQAAEVLILNIEAIALSILDATNAGLLTDPAGAATTSSLVLLGIAPEDAERIVADVRASDSSARAR